MRDLDNSLNFNFSRFNSNGWQNFALDDASQDISLMNRNSINHQQQFHFSSILNEPPQPAASIYNCLQSEPSENGSIREVQYIQNEPEAKPVNSKQYFRMMKRRIKKVMSQFAKNQNINLNQQIQDQNDKKKKRKYLYQSRHRHAVVRARGKNGQFLATRPQSERFRQKKKRGRKPKNFKENQMLENNTVSAKNQITKQYVN